MKHRVLILSNELKHHGGVVSFYRVFFEKFQDDYIEIEHHAIGSRMAYFHKPFKKAFFYPFWFFLDFCSFVRKCFNKNVKLIVVNPSLIAVAIIRDFFYVLISCFFCKKTIIFFRGWREDNFRKIKENAFLRWCFLLFCNLSDCIFVLSDTFANDLRSLSIKKDIYSFSTMFIGEEIQPRVASNDVVKFLFLGRLSTLKGINEIIEAVTKLASKRKSFSFDLVGHGVDHHIIENLKLKISYLGLQSFFAFHGHLEGQDKFVAYANADIYVLPSWQEGCPNSLLEAMASGNFILATPVGAIPAIVEDGKNGRLVNLRDSDDLAEKMEWAIDNIELVRQLGQANRKYAFNNFESQVVTDRILNVFKKRIGNAT